MDEEIVYVVDMWLIELVFGEGLLNGFLFIFFGEKEFVWIKDNNDGIFDVFCVFKEFGFYELFVDYDGVFLVGSLFKFDVVEGGVDKVKVYGKGKCFWWYDYYWKFLILYVLGGDVIGVEVRIEGGGEGVLKGFFYGC